jgi:hypothetical protein
MDNVEGGDEIVNSDACAPVMVGFDISKGEVP